MLQCTETALEEGVKLYVSESHQLFLRAKYTQCIGDEPGTNKAVCVLGFVCSGMCVIQLACACVDSSVCVCVCSGMRVRVCVYWSRNGLVNVAATVNSRKLFQYQMALH